MRVVVHGQGGGLYRSNRAANAFRQRRNAALFSLRDRYHNALGRGFVIVIGKGITMTSDRWTLSPEIARAIEEFVRRSAWQAEDSAHERVPPGELNRATSNTESVGASQADGGYALDDCPELVVLTDLLGSAEAAHDVAALLVEVTLDDIADLDRSIKACDYERAALRMHRIVGGYQILGPSLLVDEGRSLLAELRTTRSGSTLARLAHFRDRLLSLMKRIEAAVAMQRGQRLLRA